ncbi:MAG: cyclic nucleotide-binding domain-containing protein [Kiritimatiellia bacterium]
MSDWLGALGWVLAACLVIGALQLIFYRRFRIPGSLAFTLNFFVLSTAIRFGVARHPGVLGSAATLGTGIVRAVFLIASIYLGISIADQLFLGLLVPRHIHRPVPVVLRGLFRWILLAVTVFVVLRIIFPNLNLSVLAVSSIVVGYILGNASQDTLGNLFAGLALNAEQPFSIGDWIEVGSITGQVVDMNWRATWLRTKTLDQVVIPNAVIAREHIVNHSRPTAVHGVLAKVGVSYTAPPNKVRQVVLNVLGSVSGVLADPSPSVWLHEYSDFTMNYTLKFFITDFEHREDILSRVFDLLWYHFKREGILIPFPIRVQWTRDALLARDQALCEEFRAECRDLLESVELFKPLSPEEREFLVQELRDETYAAGEILLRQGDEGHSFYLLLSGTVRVSIKGESGAEVSLARLGRGDFFGEMSLLTGEKRSATVTAETDTRVAVLAHSTLSNLLARNLGLADGLATELARRVKEQQQAREAARAADTSAKPPSHGELLRRILEFFGLANAHGKSSRSTPR